MTDRSQRWSQRLGLAAAPLFEQGEIPHPEMHSVLLDGGNGSFVLSESEEPTPPRTGASWAWSSLVPHHIALSGDEVSVTRWDKPDFTERFRIQSVSDKMDVFYNYLIKDKVSGHDVVATLLELFRSVRGVLHSTGAGEAGVIHAFLDVLARLIAAEHSATNGRPDFVAVWAATRDSQTPNLGDDQLVRLEAGFKQRVASLFGFDLRASLAVRHAASAIFQEAHFTFEGSIQSDLFAYQSPNTSRPLTRGAHHFTPPPLARSIVEQAIAALPNIAARQTLAVCDPACGSGAFLTEAARTLRRVGFDGALRLVGRDTSDSAVTMARFALEAARYDWKPRGGLEIDVAVGDSLDPGGIPLADIIVMNPPFVAWPVMDRSMREKVVSTLGTASRHRPDASMAFITRALEAVRPGSVVASFIPTSLLSLESAKAWRRELLDRARLAFLGSFGQYGLFVHALVQVSAMVLVAGAPPGVGLVLEAANRVSATGEALRALRRAGAPSVVGASGDGWRMTPVPQGVFANRDNWRVLPEPVEREIRRLAEAGFPRITDLFNVRQGILTGLNDAFILNENEFGSLPENERRLFRPAIFRTAISDGKIEKRFFLFYPYQNGRLIFSSERELQRKAPTYYSGWLSNRRARLQRRSGVNHTDKPWWALSRYYKWADRKDARIVSKYFGAMGDFAVDEEAVFIPVQGYAWFPIFGGRSKGLIKRQDDVIGVQLRAYCTLLNSETFSRLLRVFSHQVAGGQFNLSPRFVKKIPMPNLNEIPGIVDELSNLANATNLMSRTWLRNVDQLAMVAWGRELVVALRELDDV
jgi:adenine-specific DNA-methyltransferase